MSFINCLDCPAREIIGKTLEIKYSDTCGIARKCLLRDDIKPQVRETDIGESKVTNEIEPQTYDDTPLTC